MSGFDLDDFSVNDVDVTSAWVLALVTVLGMGLFVLPAL